VAIMHTSCGSEISSASNAAGNSLAQKYCMMQSVKADDNIMLTSIAQQIELTATAQQEELVFVAQHFEIISNCPRSVAIDNSYLIYPQHTLLLEMLASRVIIH